MTTTKVYIEKYDFKDNAKVEDQFKSLLERELTSVEVLEHWLKEVSDFQDAIQEATDGHYIDFQANSEDKAAKEAFEYDQEEIEPLIKRYQAKLDEKFMNSKWREDLSEADYSRFIRSKQNALDLFNENNVELEVEEDKLATQYFEITGALTAEWDGEEKTITQLASFLQDPDREVRKMAYGLMFQELLKVRGDLQTVMSRLIEIREDKAKNSGLSNYRDYMFQKYERFDYTPDDCKQLAESIKTHVLPLAKDIQDEHRRELGIEDYRPYDTKAVAANQKPLKPFQTTEEFVQKTASVLHELDPRFKELIEVMNERGMLDLENRKNKSPGGFCTPLPVSELSYIFMNAANTHSDMLTLVHEMGHCIHNDLKRPIELSYYRDTPMESSELASMTMELITMDYWHHFYDNEADLKRAKLDVLKDIVTFLPGGVVIDQFQHWLYENPTHTEEERMNKYFELRQSFDPGIVNWDGYEEARKAQWLFVLHIFEVPFYYIEYVIAQLGALQMYKQYREDPEKALLNYKEALALGNTKSLYEVYEAAGIQFDFSPEMVKELMEFLQKEINELSS